MCAYAHFFCFVFWPRGCKTALISGLERFLRAFSFFFASFLRPSLPVVLWVVRRRSLAVIGELHLYEISSALEGQRSTATNGTILTGTRRESSACPNTIDDPL